MKSKDKALKRAASVIAWQLVRGATESKALSQASANEPDLTDRELNYALQWARDCLAFTESLSMAMDISENGCSLCDDLPTDGSCPECIDRPIEELAARFNLPREL